MGWISWLNLPQERVAPATKAAAITPSDTVIFPIPYKGIYTGSGGTIKVLLANDSLPITYANVPAGTVLNICPQQVFATGTTATGLIGHL